MSPKTNKKKTTSEKKEKTDDHVLLDGAEWDDPAHRTVIGEYHKTSNPETEQAAPTVSSQNQETTDSQKLLRIFNISNIEVLSYTLTRALLRGGVRIPLKIEGAVDMDISLKDSDLIMNTNVAAFRPPPLKIWRIIFSYKGKPVLEYGRGVKNNLKIYYAHAIVFLVAMWAGSRRLRKAEQQAVLNACMELSQESKDVSGRATEKEV